jgi:hypothetical protein
MNCTGGITIGAGEYNGECDSVQEGRPFRDSRGAVKMAQALESDVPLWLSPQDKMKLQDYDTKLSKNERQRLGEEWKN